MKPYLSFVAAARNDNFGGNFLHRFKLAVNSIISLSSKYNLNAEFIIVEWNPPDDRPRLKEAIEWPAGVKPGTVRIIEVPNEIHKKFNNPQKTPFFEFFAKNAGIRRAKGEYILVTNSDIIFSDEIIKYFSSRPFSENIFGRADRHDINGPMSPNLSLEEALAFCKNNIARINTMHGAMITSQSEWLKSRIINRIKGLTLKKIINKIKKYINPALENPPQKEKQGWDYKGLYIHNGGDFMLMSKNQWGKFRGYPEIGIDRGLDCYMTIAAHIAGLLQVVIPYPIYHIEHSRAEQLSRPTAVLENIPGFNKMIEAEKPVIINDKNWGLENMRLRETVVE